MAEPATATEPSGAGHPERPEHLERAAERVSALFGSVQELLTDWQEAIQAELHAQGEQAAALDALIERLVLPRLRGDDPLLVGAGFVAAPEQAGGDDLHFAWWLGPLDESPFTGATTEPTRLELDSRSYSGYLRDLPSLEWYSIPSSTHRTHIAGPYIDHLCACDYIVTVTTPVEHAGQLLGVVGADVYVRRLERELLPALLAVGRPLVVVNQWGRVLLSTEPDVLVGSVAPAGDNALLCAGTPFRLVVSATGD